MTDKQPAAFEERIEPQIFLIRGQRIMLGMHLAKMYEVEPEALEQAVKCNIECFPEDSVFQLNPDEIIGLESQVAISSRTTAPYAFTGQGVAILSSVLLDERAIHDGQESCAPTCSCRK